VRILIDYRPALRHRTGVGEYVHQLACALAAQRVDRSAERRAGDRRAFSHADGLEVFTSSWKDRPSAAALAELGPSTRVVDRRIPVRVLNAAWHRLEWPPVEWLTGHAYDVVHSPSPLLIPSSQAARLVTIHDLDFLFHPDRTRAEVRRDYPALAARHAMRADGVIVPSDHVAALVAGHLRVPPARISVCPLGVARWARPVSGELGQPDGRYLLFLGTIELRKNVRGLLEAYALLRARREDAPPLVLAGELTPEAAPLQALCARPPLSGSVEFRGYVPPEDRQALYEGARLLVLPSFDEGFGLPVAEAMSLGVPVVASNRGALPEVSGDAALLVDPDDPAAIGQAIERVLCDHGLARRLAREGRCRAEAFTWARAALLHRAAYERAIDARIERNRG
jgi:glycosyltransferase involved in cell wall biosynthesis